MRPRAIFAQNKLWQGAFFKRLASRGKEGPACFKTARTPKGLSRVMMSVYELESTYFQSLEGVLLGLRHAASHSD